MFPIKSILRRKQPLLLCVLTLCLGMICLMTYYLLLHVIFAQQLPLPSPDEITVLERGDPGYRLATPFTYPQYVHLQNVMGRQWSLATALFLPANVEDGQHNVDTRWIALASANFSTLLGLRPQLGRLLVQSDDQTGVQPVALISHDYWLSRFGGGKQVLGTSLKIEGLPVVIVGVMPVRFRGIDTGRPLDIMVPSAFSRRLYPDADPLASDRFNGWTIITRLAQAGDLNALRIHLATAWPHILHDLGRGPEIISADTIPRGVSGVREPLIIPFQIVGLLVFLVCLVTVANTIQLMLTDFEVRRPDIATAIAFGATRLRVLSYFVASTIAAVAVALLLSAPLAAILARAILRSLFLASKQEAMVFDLGAWFVISRLLLLFAILVTTLCLGMMFALRRVSSLEYTGRTTNSVIRWPHSVMMVQLGLSVLLMTAASALFVKLSKLSIEAMSARFDGVHVLVVDLHNQQRSSSSKTLDANLLALREALRGGPAETNSAEAAYAPFSGTNATVDIDFVQSSQTHLHNVYVNYVTHEYFSALRTPIIAGRSFVDSDVDKAVISEAIYDAGGKGGISVGSRIAVSGLRQPVEVIGVVSQSHVRSLKEVSPPQVFLEWRDHPKLSEVNIITRSESASIAPHVTSTALQFLPDSGLRSYELTTAAADTVAPELAALKATSTLVACAIGLCGLGTGVFGHLAVALRRKEIGLRLAVGATRGDVRTLFLVEAWKRVLIASSAALPFALVLALVLWKAYGIHLFSTAMCFFFSVGCVLVLAVSSSLPSASKASMTRPEDLLRGAL